MYYIYSIYGITFSCRVFLDSLKFILASVLGFSMAPIRVSAVKQAEEYCKVIDLTFSFSESMKKILYRVVQS